MRTTNIYLKFCGWLGIISVLIVALGFVRQASVARPAASAPIYTTPPELVYAQRALAFIAERESISIEFLRLVMEEEITFALSGRHLWHGRILDIHGRLHLLYDVWLDGETQAIVNGRADPLDYWHTEEKLFRAHYQARLLQMVAAREARVASDLRIVEGMVLQYPVDGAWIWQGKVLDADGNIYEVAMDGQGQARDVAEITQAVSRQAATRYGKLEPRLFYLLPRLPAESTLRVLLWAQGVDYAWVDTQLAAAYPYITADYFASGQPFIGRGQPVLVDAALFTEMRATYNDLLDRAYHQASAPIVVYLKSQGYEVEVWDVAPCVYAELPVSVIQALNTATIPNLATIYLGETALVPQKMPTSVAEARLADSPLPARYSKNLQMNSARSTLQVEAVWNQGYQGQGVRMGILDIGVVNPINHPAFASKLVYPSNQRPDLAYHAGQIAGIMLGDDTNHPEYRGVAYGSAELFTAGADPNSWKQLQTGLDYLVENQAFVINVSLGVTGTRALQAEDRLFDLVVRDRDPFIAVAAGNNGQVTHEWHVNSPGKAYNVITVGAFADQDDALWDNDVMWEKSCYVDPHIEESTTITYAKPDVVAVGVNVTTVYDPLIATYRAVSGTSYATPQVASIAALLIQRYYHLHTNPETLKAMIMVAAINNIEDNTAVIGEQDGAGGVSAAQTLAVHERGGWAHHIITDVYDFTAPSNPFSDNLSDYDFKGSDTTIWDIGHTNAMTGNHVRAGLCWNSNPAGSVVTGTDKLATDFDLRIIAPDGSTQVAASTSYYNSCELVDFIAPQTGEYRLRVKYYNRGGEGLNLGLGLAWLPMPVFSNSVYIPLTVRSAVAK